ncbi:MAG: hypothetical protein M3P12_01155 [Gemmatimonadota bacterium]|nr:hypothetical protein [Gemmatimonadota bacterium]
MDVYGSDTAPDEEAAGTSGEAAPDVRSWFQRGSGNEALLNDRGIAVPVNAMLDRVREADALTFEDEEGEE